MKPRFKIVASPQGSDKPRLRPIQEAEPSKLDRAIAYLRERRIYILDRDTPKPKWGLAGDVPAGESTLLKRIMGDDLRRKA